MKNLIQNLTKEKTLINKVFLALLCSQLVIILTTFFKVAMLPSFGKLNLYALDSVTVLFLISSVIEIVFTLKKNEKVFIPLRVVNLLWLFSLIGNLTKQIENLQMTESALDFGAGVVENLYSWLTFGIVDFSIPRSGYSSLLGTVNVIRIVADISLVLLLAYLYFRFIKKDEFDTTPCLKGNIIAALQTAYNLDNIVTIASIALIVSPFLRFMSNGPIVVTAFGRKPFFALATVALGVVVIRGGTIKGCKSIRKVNSCDTHYLYTLESNLCDAPGTLWFRIYFISSWCNYAWCYLYKETRSKNCSYRSTTYKNRRCQE